MIFFKKNTPLPPFIPLPRFMIASEHSINAKLLYGLLLNRTLLSQKSGWVSEDGNVYVIYTIKQMADDLDDRRIYDRVLEVCVPVLFDGENFRKGNAAENLKKANRILNNENGGN